MLKFYLYPWYEYQSDVLAFIHLPEPLSADQKVDILQFLDTECYGCTAQETTEFALEMELWMRNMLCDSSLCINPKHLEMGPSVVEGICQRLGVASENAKAFSVCVNSTSLQEYIERIYTEDPDVQEGFDLLSWDDIYERADGTGFGDPELTAKDTARWQLGGLIKEERGVDIEAPSVESAEEEIDFFLEDREYPVFFDAAGHIIVS